MQLDKEIHNDVATVELEDLNDSTEPGKSILGSDKYLSVVKDVEIRLTAVLGETELTVGNLFKLKEGGVLPLNKLSSDPIELLLNGQVVAKGNLVVVNDNFGIQLIEVCEL